MTRTLCVFLFLIVTKVSCQQATLSSIAGRITSDASSLEGVYVINLKSEYSAITDVDGRFVIVASVGDTLLFSGSQFNRKKLVVKSDYFAAAFLSVKMDPIVNQLKEVIVQRKSSISATSLGIISTGQKKYTAAERKLHTATDLNASASMNGMAGGSISADPLINLLSGRTKMLKKEIEVEKKESYLKQLEKLFDLNYFVNKLKIPADYVNGFKYFAIENAKLTSLLKANNIAMTTFFIGELAANYNEMISSENK